MTLLLTESEVEQLLDMPTTIQAVEEAFRALAAGCADNVPRVRAKAPGIVLHSMCAAADYLGLVGWKQYTTTRAGARFHVGLYDQQSGELLALIEADRLGQMRTGAVTGVAVKHLSQLDVNEIGLFGTGWQAESQLAAIAAVRPLERARCFSRNEQKRAVFAEKMSAELKINVTPVEQPRDAVAGMPIVVTATTSREPVFDGDWLEPGALVCAVGSNWLQKSEIDVTTIRRAEQIVCDSIACCKNEAGDFVPAIEQDVFDWSRVTELADVVSRLSVAPDEAGITIFKSVGMAVEDIAVAARLIDRATRAGMGTTLGGAR